MKKAWLFSAGCEAGPVIDSKYVACFILGAFWMQQAVGPI